MLTRNITVAGIALLLLTRFSPASAMEISPYIFGNIGAAEPDIGRLEQEYNTLAEQAYRNGGTSSIALDDHDLSASLGLGLQFNRYFAIEISYLHLGNYQVEADGGFSDGMRNMTAEGGAEIRIRGWGAQGVFIVPISTSASATLSAGVAELQTDIEGSASYRYTSQQLSQTEIEHYDESFTDTVGFFSVGGRYAVNETLSLRLDYSYLGGVSGHNEEEINMINAGLAFYF